MKNIDELLPPEHGFSAGWRKTRFRAEPGSRVRGRQLANVRAEATRSQSRLPRSYERRNELKCSRAQEEDDRQRSATITKPIPRRQSIPEAKQRDRENYGQVAAAICGA
jgi:hypothetical protein